VQVQASDQTGLTLHVSFPNPSFVARSGNGVQYLDMVMDGLGSPGAVGSPNVPALTRFFAIPQGADVSVRELGSSGYVLDNVLLWPQQDEAADPTAVEFEQPAFSISQSAYALNAYTKATSVAKLGTLRDLAVGGVEADGAQYNPAARSLRVLTSLDVRVDFTGKSTGVFADGRAGSIWNLAAQKQYASSLLNAGVASQYLGPITKFRFCGVEYLIVTTHALKPAADTLAAARNADGIWTNVVTLGSDEGDIGTTKEQIQTYLRSRINDPNCIVRPSYIGILGNTAQVPTFKPNTPWPASAFDGKIASDLPYALANDTDLLPDVAIGRMPAPDLATANTVVSKIIGYEDSPPFFGVGDFYNHATVTSFFQCGLDDGGQPCNPGTRDERTFTKLSETVRDGLIASGKTVDRVYTTTAVTPQQYYDGTALPAALLRANGFLWNGTGTDVLNDWNAGRFLILHRDHGSPPGWGNPDFDTGDIPSLTNGAKLPVVFSINCASGKFDDAMPNFSEQLLQKADGGAVGVIGDSRNSPSATNSHLARGLIDAIFTSTMGAYGSSTPILRMGDVLVSGKLYMNTQNGLDGQTNATTQAEHYLYHWFGDPTMPIWTSRPFLWARVFTASVLQNVVRLQSSDDAADGSVATLYLNGQALDRAFVKAGAAEFPLPEGVQGRFEVVVDKDGYVPAQVSTAPIATDNPR
jgi:hypothetical protein